MDRLVSINVVVDAILYDYVSDEYLKCDDEELTQMAEEDIIPGLRQVLTEYLQMRGRDDLITTVKIATVKGVGSGEGFDY